MACDVPVVSSAGGSLSEVLGDGATMVNTFKHSEWIESIQDLLFNSEIRKKQIAFGFRQAHKFSWNVSA